MRSEKPENCTCFWVDPKTWQIQFGDYQPGGWFQGDPGCPVHG
jgi:hypothetical protein